MPHLAGSCHRVRKWATGTRRRARRWSSARRPWHGSRWCRAHSRRVPRTPSQSRQASRRPACTPPLLRSVGRLGGASPNVWQQNSAPMRHVAPPQCTPEPLGQGGSGRCWPATSSKVGARSGSAVDTPPVGKGDGGVSCFALGAGRGSPRRGRARGRGSHATTMSKKLLVATHRPCPMRHVVTMSDHRMVTVLRRDARPLA